VVGLEWEDQTVVDLEWEDQIVDGLEWDKALDPAWVIEALVDLQDLAEARE